MNIKSAVSRRETPFESQPGYSFTGNDGQRDYVSAGCGSGPIALVVDDAPDIAFMFAVVLKHAGYRVVYLLSGPAALNAARQQHFDVIVSDIGLGAMDGYELARELRALPEYVVTPMISVSGYSEYGDHQRAVSAGFNAHLTKPVDPDKLVEIIGRLGSCAR
jgi:CheY-like chemotaxis protein